MLQLSTVFSCRRSVGASLLCACLSLGFLVAPETAHAGRKKNTSTTSQEVKKKGSVKIKHQRSASEESTSERERRLFRECKGRPNAGACLGFTQR